ncbi:PREDICTED: uncharacterized protein LOC108374726 [Rhagoletis zephyria]|uniref:uncharacterized protein LOC108374726 n=1 Tax=Rhagoletis zephyria TaxID=28612 RepID=UPI0008115422|nr:PREDICTED: uncharacterized protein LOC108374726 [Rhagoletis zephyria]
MKYFNITLLLVVLALACCISLTYAQEEGPASLGPKRPALRRPVGGKVAKTTTTPPPPQQEDEGDYGDEDANNPEGEEGDENDAAASSTTTTTEAPKKVIGPVIRPFRSNDDFLNSLKRRQQDAKKHRAVEKPTPKSKQSPADDEGGDEGAESAPAPAPAKGFKAGSTALNRRKLLAKPGKPEPPAPADDTDAEESEQEPKEQARRLPHARLALRKRN